MSLTLTILGCGSSGGVPRIGNHWGVCDPKEPKNRRRRCSVMLERRSGKAATRVLIDASPDLREQLLDYGTGEIDAVLFTHEHADHTHGIDELRAVALNTRARVPIWANDRTGTMLLGRFGYCFYTPPGSDYPPILRMNRIAVGEPVEVDGPGGSITARPFELQHGTIRALGFRIGDTAYTPDLNDIPDKSLDALKGLDTWIVDALRPTPHPSHLSLPETLAWIKRLKPRRAILTNLHIDMDYEALAAKLPKNVIPAHDGLEMEIAA